MPVPAPRARGGADEPRVERPGDALRPPARRAVEPKLHRAGAAPEFAQAPRGVAAHPRRVRHVHAEILPVPRVDDRHVRTRDEVVLRERPPQVAHRAVGRGFESLDAAVVPPRHARQRRVERARVIVQPLVNLTARRAFRRTRPERAPEHARSVRDAVQREHLRPREPVVSGILAGGVPAAAAGGAVLLGVLANRLRVPVPLVRDDDRDEVVPAHRERVHRGDGDGDAAQGAVADEHRGEAHRPVRVALEGSAGRGGAHAAGGFDDGDARAAAGGERRGRGADAVVRELREVRGDRGEDFVVGRRAALLGDGGLRPRGAAPREGRVRPEGVGGGPRRVQGSVERRGGAVPRGAGVDGAVRGDGGVRAHRRDGAVARARRDEVGVGIVREARLHGLEVQEGHRAATRRRGEARAHERLAHRGVRAPHAERGGLQRDVAGREDGRRVPRQGAVRAAATRRGESARGERDDDSRIDERGRGPPRGQQARQVAPPARGGRGHPEDRASRGRADREMRARGTRSVAAAAPELPPKVPSESERRPEVTRWKRPQRSDCSLHFF